MPAQSIELEHLYYSLQAALDALGVAIGYSSLVLGDVATGRLVMPFGPLAFPTPGYFLIVREERQHDPAVKVFCDWLAAAGADFERESAMLLPQDNLFQGP